MENFNDKLDAIFEVIENIPADALYIPTVEELRKNKVEKDIEKYLPYLLWVSEMLVGTKNKKEKETNRYINYLVSQLEAAEG